MRSGVTGLHIRTGLIGSNRSTVLLTLSAVIKPNRYYSRSNEPAVRKWLEKAGLWDELAAPRTTERF